MEPGRTSTAINVWNEILRLTRRGVVRPVIGQSSTLADVPDWLDAVENRRTKGRTVVTL
ncbi:hypothetical protein I6A84_04005 [Frankia sp. CNm7]|uniref:Zinc-binding dehydrogenase n=1 Tax=Frankia nepalensis TaxID=1836974 RepID=A0A937UKN9_9ACTN|nr:hypothetical protein [Frankia nepalensis]MBL7500871.1 hypothetical protein [Frankia nepalensis]MBL7509237.1 hypothetical protein [Frankia nepalensis]MBL7517304.1 hypothetical protein [Frankia nepalensis]MBL7626999.1 hypothetical protein [Frankia nepalensis]